MTNCLRRVLRDHCITWKQFGGDSRSGSLIGRCFLFATSVALFVSFSASERIFGQSDKAGQANASTQQDVVAPGDVGKESAASQMPDVIVYGPAPSTNQDPWSPVASERLVGRIQELNAEIVVLTTSSGKRQLPSDRIERVEVAWASEEARTAHELFLKHDFRAVARMSGAVMKSGIPDWQRRVMVGEFIESVFALGQVEIAGRLFLDLAKESPPAFILGSMPLNWTTVEPRKELVKTATTWMEDSSDYSGLLGASWLLLTPQSAAAKARLLKLGASDSILVKQLAAAQLWRLVPPPETRSNLEQWRNSRNRMLKPLQLGPTEFLAERLSRTGEPTLALEEWMRIATAHSHQYFRAKSALMAAQIQLQSTNKSDQAEKIAQWIESLEVTSP